MKALLAPARRELSQAVISAPIPGLLAQPCRLFLLEDGGAALASEGLTDGTVGGLPVVEVDLTKAGLRFAGQAARRVISDQALTSPLMAVEPRPWRREPAARSVAVLLPDEAAYRRALRAALTLGQERMRAASLADGRVLVTVEDPSFFLVMRWHEEPGREVFWRGSTPRVYLPWGYQHPLAKRWRGTNLGEDLFFLAPDGTWTNFAEPELRDVYQGLDLELPGAVEARLEPRGDIPVVPVGLRWGFRPLPAEGQVWLLPPPGDETVEALLTSLPERDLGGVQLAIARDGEQDLFLVRKLARRGTSRGDGLELPGQAFSQYAGYGNLLLPADRRLEPPIRADRFRELLGLVPGEIVVLLPTSGDEGFRVLRLAERAFQPLESLVEYRIQAAEARLEELRAACVFDFGALEYAPVRSATHLATPGEPTPGQVPDASEAPPEDLEGPPPPGASVELPTPRPKPPKPRPAAAPVEALADDARAGPDPEELALEDAALSGGDAASWGALAEYKAAQGKWADVLFAAEEARWCDAEDDAARSAYRAWLEQILELDAVPEAERFDRVSQSRPDTQEAREAAARYLPLRLAEQGGGEALREGLAVVYRELRGAKLRRKARWLAWSETLAQNGDQSEVERQRESILGSLSRRGLDPEDRPSYLGRHLRSRAGLDEWLEQVDLPAHLELLERAARAPAAGPSRAEAEALVLRTAIEADREGKGEELRARYEAARPSQAEPSLVTASFYAGACSYASAEEAEREFRQVLAQLRTVENPRDRVFRHLFDNLLFADSFSGAQNIVGAALEVVRELRPGVAARVLPEVASALLALGARDELAATARALLAQPEVARDIFLVELAATALSRALEPEGYSQPDLETLAECILAASPEERFDILYLDLIEAVVVGLGPAFLETLGAKVSEEAEQSQAAGVYPQLILGACRLKLWAEQGRVAEGLDQVEGALAECWQLPDPLRARALGRYVQAVAHFGNVARGGEFLRGVVDAAYALSDRELEEFYRGEILGAVAWAAGQLGDPATAVGVLETILSGVEARLERPGDDVSLLFEVLSHGIEVLLELGEWHRGGPLVERIEGVIKQRIGQREGVQRGPWFYLHRARLVCARALLFMGRDVAGAEALDGALRDFQRVSILDRTELLEEAAKVLPFVDGGARREALGRMVELLETSEDIGEYDRAGRSEVVMAMAAAVRPGADSYRREQSRWDALEARGIRRRVAAERPADRKDGARV